MVERDDANNEIILSLEELKAIQRGAPLGLVVTQVEADVARWNPATQSFDSREGWSSFEGEIDPVVVNIKANLGNDEIYNYQVYVGTDFYDLGFTFKDVIAQVFEVAENNGVTTIAGRRYPDDWYVSSPSPVVIQEWNNSGQPQSLFGITMFRNSKMVLMSPGSSPQARVDLATFSPDFKKVYVSAFPGNFPILSVRAQVTINGQPREVELEADNNSFYTNATEFEDAADVDGQVVVENARGDITVATIILPALYKNAQEVKDFSSFLPKPGGEYLMFSGRDPNKPVKLYCLFDDPKTGNELSEPREYLTLPASSESTNYIDWIFDPFHRRMYFSKVRIDPDNFKVIPFDTTFTARQWIGDQRFITQDPPLAFGSIHLEFAHLDSASARVDLTGTPFSLDPYTEFVHAQRGADDIIYVDESRQIMTVRAIEPPGHTSDSEGSIGIKPDSISLVYNRDFYSGASSIDLPGKAAQFNMSSEGSKGYINMGSSNTLEVSTSITIEAWIKPEPHGRPNSSTGFAVFLNREGEYELSYVPEDGSIRWALATGSPGWTTINTYYRALTDEWLHVALTYDSGAEQPAIKTYINGNLFHATVASGPISDFSAHQNQDSFRIAAREGTADHYSGVIDEVRIWNVARTQEEIRAALVDTLGPEIYEDTASGLIGYWRFDELEDLGIGGDGAADDVRDYSLNGNHGDLVGDVQLSDITTSVKLQDPTLPGDFTLQQNYPNPFNPQTQISFILPERTRIKLQIFNLKGQKVATILKGLQPAGQYTATWSGRDEAGNNVASGIYLYRLQAGGLVQTRKMTLLR